MSVIESKAAEVITHTQKSPVNPKAKLVFDPAIIVAIIGVITNLISSFKCCNKTPAAAAKDLRDGRIYTKWEVRRAVRSCKLPYDHKVELMPSILHVNTKVTDSEMTSMYKEAA